MSPTAVHVPVFMQPQAGDAAINYSAQEWRQYTNAAVAANEVVSNVQGIAEPADYKVTQHSTPNLSVDVAAGLAYVLGDDVTAQGPYMVWNDATFNVTGITVPGAGTFHHRIVLQIQDKLNNGAWSGYTAAIMALLDVGGGLIAEPNSAITLATIDVPAASANITNAMINDFRQQVGPIAKVKTADLTRTVPSGAITLTNDPDLQLFNLAANATYEVRGVLVYSGGSSGGDFAWQYVVSAGCGGVYSKQHISPGGNFGGFGSSLWPPQHAAGTTGTGNLQDVLTMGLLTTGAAPVSLVLQWAQNTNSGTGTTLRAGSWLRAQRLA